MGYAFISYSSKNQQMAESFRTMFNQSNIKTWMAPGDIPFGSTYTSTINGAIKGASCFVLLLSESAQNSQWVLRETERAVSYGKTVFPVLLDDVPMNDDFEFMLSTSQAIAIRKIDVTDVKIQRLLSIVSASIDEGDKAIKESYNNNDNSIDDSYFIKNAVMHGTSLHHFKGRLQTHVVIPEGVTIIEARAFAFYPDLLGISIPSSVKKIEECAFVDCPKLSAIVIAPTNPVFRAEGNCCIERATNRLVFGCSTSRIPEGVTVIGEEAFDGCKNLTAINIPASVTRIEKSAFSGCENLKSVSLPDGLTDIGKFAFSSCCRLAELVIPKGVTSMSSHAFYNCYGLETIRVALDNPIYYSKDNCCIEKKAQRLVLGCKNSIIPDNVIDIGEAAFGGCQKLCEITIPGSVKRINSEAFCECGSLTSLVLTNGVERIGSKSFMYCASMSKLYISDSVSELDESAFINCSRLDSIIVSPGNAIFRSEDNCCIRRKDNVLVLGCMSSIIPDGVTEIGNYAFYDCYALTDVYLPESVTKIGANAFGRSGLHSITIPQSVKYIGPFAFNECDNLMEIVISNGVIYIGELAFGDFDSESEKRDIFCEARKKPARWHREWTDDDSNVYWQNGWYYDENGIPQLIIGDE